MAISSDPFARIKKPLNSDMNVVPYIDVMLVLLVIFMITAPMLTTGVEVNLPQADANTVASSENLPAIVSVNADGELFLSDSEVSDLAVSQADLIALLNQRQPLPKVLINADQVLSYGHIMTLMADLQQAGITQVGLLTESQPIPPSS